MTVVTMFSFGDSGIAVADEQASGYIRKSNIANKLKAIGRFVFGGAGRLDIIEEIYDRIEKEIPLEADFAVLGERLTGLLLKDMYIKRDSWLKAVYNITISDFLTGKIHGADLENDIKKKVSDMYENINHTLLQNEIIVGGMEGEQFEIYSFVFGQAILRKVPFPFFTIGNGSDEASRILLKYIEQKKWKERKSIDKVEGLIKIMESTNQAAISILGVGGIPQIAYTNKGGTKWVEEEKCLLASEIVKGMDFGQLPYDFVSKSLSDLIFGDASFETVEEDLKKKAKDWKEFDRMLRGYRV